MSRFVFTSFLSFKFVVLLAASPFIGPVALHAALAALVGAVLVGALEAQQTVPVR